MAIIEVSNLVKRYGSYPAVNDISFTVEEGDIDCFAISRQARPGSGKSGTTGNEQNSGHKDQAKNKMFDMSQYYNLQ